MAVYAPANTLPSPDIHEVSLYPPEKTLPRPPGRPPGGLLGSRENNHCSAFLTQRHSFWRHGCVKGALPSLYKKKDAAMLLGLCNTPAEVINIFDSLSVYLDDNITLLEP